MALLSGLFGCSTSTPTIAPVDQVELERFMGDWYVIGNIPTFIEKNVYNAVETYQLGQENQIDTTFRYRKGGFDKEVKTMNPTGFVRPDTNNAVWDMQFIWPFKAEYVIVYLDPEYQQTIIGRSDRDYAWIMARTPEISAEDYQAHQDRLVEMGYSLENLRKVPQQWPES